MNYLLFRYESGNRNRYHSTVPIDVVWKKVLMSPDPSNLEIFYQGKRIGNCRWVAGAGEEQMRKFLQSDEGEPTKTPIQKPTFYTIDFDGSVMVKGMKGNARFYFHTLLQNENVWSNLSLRVSMENLTVNLNALAADETVLLRIDTPQETFSKKFTFAELMNPTAILQSLGGPLSLLLLPELPSGSGTNLIGTTRIDLNYRSYYDNLTIGKSPLRVYKVEVILWGKFKAVATISRAGEILKIELPDNLVLINEALVNL